MRCFRGNWGTFKITWLRFWRWWFDLKRVFGGGGGGGIPEAPAACSSAEKVSALSTPPTPTPTTSPGHSPQPIFSLALLHDGRVVSGSGNQTLRIWRPYGDTFEFVGSLKGHSKDVNAIAVLPDGVRIVSGSDDWMLKVWNLAKDPPACEATLRRHDGQVRAIAILGTLGFVSGSNDNNLAVWTKSTASGGFVCNSAILEGHSDAVRAVAALADGRVVSGSRGQDAPRVDQGGRKQVYSHRFPGARGTHRDRQDSRRTRRQPRC